MAVVVIYNGASQGCVSPFTLSPGGFWDHLQGERLHLWIGDRIVYKG